MPDKREVILSGQSDDEFTCPLRSFDDTLSCTPPPLSPRGSPPKEAHDDGEPEPESSKRRRLTRRSSTMAHTRSGFNTLSEDNTKRSFDFISELTGNSTSLVAPIAPASSSSSRRRSKPPLALTSASASACRTLTTKSFPQFRLNLRHAPVEDGLQSFRT